MELEMMAKEELQARRFINSITVIVVSPVSILIISSVCVHFLVGQVFPCLLYIHHDILLPFPLRKNIYLEYS